MKTHRGMKVKFHVILICALDGVVSFTPQPLYPEGNKVPVPLHWPKAHVDRMEETDSIPYMEFNNGLVNR
jgi:hypothetical protein